MNRRFFSSLLAVLLLPFSWLAQAQDTQNSITLSSQKAFGEIISMWVKPEAKGTIQVDWGDGTLQNFTIDPNGIPYERKVSGSLLGSSIKLYGKFTELECTGEQISACSFAGQEALTLIDFKVNALTKEGIDFTGAPNIENLNLDENQITLLDLSMLPKLAYFTANKNPQLGDVKFAEGAIGLKQISLANCDISHFNPREWPELVALNLEGNYLMELDLTSGYPKLGTLNVRGNAIPAIELKKCPLLSKLDITGNLLTDLHLESNPELLGLFCAQNKLHKIDLSANSKLVDLDCSENLLTQIDLTALPVLSSVNVSGNKINSLDLSKNTYLRSLRSAETLIPVFNLYNNNALRYIDVRNNPQMSPCAFNFMTSTMWPSSAKAWSANLLVDGSNAEGADFSTVTSTEYGWKLDITIDPSVPLVTCDSVDFTVVAATGGTISFSQFDPKENVYKSITNKAFAGAPIRYEKYPEQGYTLKGLKVNGTLVSANPFVVSQASTIEPLWQLTSRITLGTVAQKEVSFALSILGDEEITIDWGNGVPVPYTLMAGEVRRFDDTTLGQTIVIEGPVSAADFSSYPGMGLWDNEFNSISVSNSDVLTSLSLYMNPVGELKIGNCPNLEELDCAYTGLTTLDLKGYPKLRKLQCYGNQITSLDLSANVELRKLEARNNQLSTISLEANTQLEEIDLQNNTLNTIDLSAQPHLTTLKLGENLFTSLDLSHNTLLQTLLVDHNELTELDLGALQDLSILYCNQNKLVGLDLSKNTKLGYLNCANNGFSACALNDLYYMLPQRTDLAGQQLPDNVFLRVSDGEAGSANEVATSESTLATIKGWTLNAEGDGTGCPEAYITILPSKNGSVSVKETETGKAIPSGTKVRKSTHITVDALPDTDFVVEKILVNGVALLGNAFPVQQASYIQALFQKDIAVNQIDRRVPFVLHGNQIELLPEVTAAALFTTNGVQIWQQKHQNTTPVLESGSYILSIEWEGQNISYKILVP